MAKQKRRMKENTNILVLNPRITKNILWLQFTYSYYAPNFNKFIHAFQDRPCKNTLGLVKIDYIIVDYLNRLRSLLRVKTCIM